MTRNEVRVSIGLPVYNGEKYLANTIESLLMQSYQHFELIIIDNASTDGTASICEKFASADSRIKVHRVSINKGAAWSFNRAFTMASGEYFKWAADDDLHHPLFLERCVEVLDQKSNVVLCFARTAFIDQDGQFIREYDYSVDVLTCSRRDLFRFLVGAGHIVHEIFGLIRSEALRRSPLIGGYVGSDIVLLGKLALWGRFHQVPEVLFEHREHTDRASFQTASQYTQWFDSSKINKRVAPRWRRYYENLKSVLGSQLPPSEQAILVFDMAQVMFRQRRKLWFELCSLITPKRKNLQ